MEIHFGVTAEPEGIVRNVGLRLNKYFANQLAFSLSR